MTGDTLHTTASTPLSGWARRVLHLLAIAAGWLLFVWGWRLVTAGHPEAGDLRTLLIGSLTVLPVLTLAWVLHNVGIHHRKGPRRSVPRVDMRYERDFNQRALRGDWPALAVARVVDIRVDGDIKQYSAAAPVEAAG